MIGLSVIVAVIVVIVVLIARVLRRRAAARGLDPSTAAVDEPMTGLESALAMVTDRDGRPIRERIEAEAQHVDQLRVPDDTGPVLRRALDHVEQPGSAPDRAASASPGVVPGDGT